MKQLKQMKPTQNSIIAALSQLKSSFGKMKEKFILSWVYDAVFYALIVLLFTQLLSLLTNQLAAVEPLMQQAAGSAELAEQAVSVMSKLIWTAGASVVLIPLLLLALYSLFKGLIWHNIAGTRFGWKPFWKFFLLNLIWYVVSLPVFSAWLMLVFYLATLFGLKWIAWILLVLSIIVWLHLLATMHYSFAHNQKIGKSLGDIFKVGFAKINKFIARYAVAVAALLAWSQLWRIVAGFKMTVEVQLILFGVVIAAPFFGWLRIYIAEGLKTVFKN